ncbi:MAG: DNA-3-methyladenine glycosylase I [Oscillospiraceae bacterium]|nr:DNA-3-methyladenine glycosylase I [Oscillospiraceae bacterium]
MAGVNFLVSREVFILFYDGCALERFLWNYVNGKPILNTWEELEQMPAKIALSDTISRDLEAFGFKFAGSVIVYSYLQAVGLVNDHIAACGFKIHNKECKLALLI